MHAKLHAVPPCLILIDANHRSKSTQRNEGNLITPYQLVSCRLNLGMEYKAELPNTELASAKKMTMTLIINIT